MLKGAVDVKVAAVSAAAALTTLLATGCSAAHRPSVADCRAAMEQQYNKATAGQKNSDPEPAACRGVPAATLRTIAEDIVSNAFLHPAAGCRAAMEANESMAFAVIKGGKTPEACALLSASQVQQIAMSVESGQ